MSKTIVKNSEGMQTPFLRGILTSSLMDAGVEFDLAYYLASEIRQQINDKQQITTSELRDIVTSKLKGEVAQDIIESFTSAASSTSTIMVINAGKDPLPFSRAQHRLCMESCGLSSEESNSITLTIYNNLLVRGSSEISSNELGRMTYQLLLSELDENVAKRYLIWSDFLHSGRPLIILIGGTAGVGKSTIATEVGHRFGIVRTQSTDMLREVMRIMTPQRLSPVLHTSSYNAWKVQPGIEIDEPMTEQLVVGGYLRQAELISVACEAILNRAIKEQVSLILEGVHFHPGLLEILPNINTAIIAPVMLSVLKAGKLKERLKGRGQEVQERRAKRYLEHFSEIWELQSFLMAEADRYNVPIVSNINKERAIQDVMKNINDILFPYFSFDIDEVFPV
ncbi:MAG: hypothetical protein KAI22_02930 [Gammaproteobacteria bacterium]|nr:hypothetical protein [Gammaproteobacteria bacterium]